MQPRLWRNLDWGLIALVAVAAGAGFVIVPGVMATSPASAQAIAYAKKEAFGLAVGVGAMVVCATVDYHVWLRWRRALYALLLLTLAAVLVLGRHTLGAKRWITVAGFEIQPSEVGKILLVVWLAGLLAPNAGKLRRWRQLLLPALTAAIPAGLVALEPDLGTSLCFAAVLVGLCFTAGFPGERLLLAVALALGSVVAAVVAHLRWHLPIPLHEYQIQRLLAFLNPLSHPKSTGYQIYQSESALGSGRVLGTGLFSGGVNHQLNFLPERQSDFVFDSIGNVLGFVGAAAVLLVLGLIVWRAVRCTLAARDPEGALLAAGLATMFAFQTILNAGVALGVMPVTGVPLPFFSYGGSAAMANFAAIGLLQSVYARRKKIHF